MSKENQKEKIKKRSEKTPKKIGDIPWAFFDSSSVAAGLQSAMQRWEWRMKISPIRPISVRKKYIRVWIILSWTLIYRIKRIYTMSNLKDSCYSCDYFPLVSGSSTNLVVKNQPQAVTLANPSEIPMHRKKTKVKKNPCQRLRVHLCNPWAFFDLRSVAAGSQNELWQGLSLFIFI